MNQSWLFQFDESFQLWFRWEHVTSGCTRTTSHFYRRTTISSTHVDDTYRIASTAPEGNLRKIISFRQFTKDKRSEEDQEDWAMRFLSIPEDDGYRFAQQVLNNKGQTAGDGSCKEGRLTGGFLSLKENDIKGGIQGATEVPLTEEDSTPYSGELGRIQVAIAATHKICSWHGITTGTITHRVDNNAALTNCFGPREPDISTACFHMVKRIQAEIKASPFKWVGKKVKTHQDKDKDYNKLDCWGKANVVADEIAKKHLERIKNLPRWQHNIQQSEGWTMSLTNNIVTTKFEKKIIAHCTETDKK